MLSVIMLSVILPITKLSQTTSQWNSSFILEGTTEKVYKCYTLVLYNYVRQATKIVIFCNNYLFMQFYNYKNLMALLFALIFSSIFFG